MISMGDVTMRPHNPFIGVYANLSTPGCLVSDILYVVCFYHGSRYKHAAGNRVVQENAFV